MSDDNNYYDTDDAQAAAAVKEEASGGKDDANDTSNSLLDSDKAPGEEKNTSTKVSASLNTGETKTVNPNTDNSNINDNEGDKAGVKETAATEDHDKDDAPVSMEVGEDGYAASGQEASVNLQLVTAESDNNEQTENNTENPVEESADKPETTAAKGNEDENSSNGNDVAKPIDNITAAISSKKRSAESKDGKPVKKRRRSAFPSFAEMLYQLMAFRCKHGSCRVPSTEQPLYAWCAYVRRAYNERRRGLPANYLNQERLNILNSIDFTWSLLQSSNDQRWETNFQKLLEYKNEHAHCNAPQSTPLGKWIQMQRDQYRERQLQTSEGKKSGRPIIPLDRIAKLEEAGFCWRVAPPAMGWEGRYEQLLEFKERFGHTNVAQGWKENIQLGRWVMKQRVQYHKRQRGEKSQMTDYRIKKLEDIGFNWVGAGKAKIKLKHPEDLTTVDGEVQDLPPPVEFVTIQQDPSKAPPAASTAWMV